VDAQAEQAGPPTSPPPACAPMQVKSGNDDLRQDAVMQQFFWLVNQFLAQEPRTARRALFIRTFKASRGGGGGGAPAPPPPAPPPPPPPGGGGGGGGGVRSRTRARNQACRYRWGWGSLHGGGVSGGACAQVVPFSPAAGLLEWVEATLPLGDYLLGPGRSGGAHMRYRRPGDLTWTEAYTKVRGAAGLLACS
jgi:hypothetical protein